MVLVAEEALRGRRIEKLAALVVNDLSDVDRAVVSIAVVVKLDR